jgi:hypothetical protein
MVPTGVKTDALWWCLGSIGRGAVDHLLARRWRKHIEIGIEIEIGEIRRFDIEPVFDLDLDPDPDFDFDFDVKRTRSCCASRLDA